MLTTAAALLAAPADGRQADALVEKSVDLASLWYNASGSTAVPAPSEAGTSTDTCGVEVTFSPQSCCGENAFAGALEAFALGASGKIMHTFQRTGTTGMGWAEWAPLYTEGEELVSFRSGAALVRAADGRLEIFANAVDSAIYHKYQLAPNGGAGWSPWLRIADSFGMEGAPSALLSSEGSMQLFSRSVQKTLMYNAQLRNASGVFWAGWQTLSGAPPTLTPTRTPPFPIPHPECRHPPLVRLPAPQAS